MTFLPIVVRELRVASRRRSTYWQRSGTALAVMAIGAWLFFVMQHEPPHRVAQFLFGLLTGGAVLYCLFSGVRYTADCLSEEKREGTLGLLFLTDLKGYDVVSGKLAATSLSSFYAVLAVVPMLALPLLLGGVTPGEFGRMALVAINTLFFSLAAGICVSALCRNARRAMGMTFLLILLFAAGFPAIWAWLAFVGRAKQVSGIFLLPSAGCNYYTAFDATYNTMRQARLFWGSLLLVHSLGWIFLALASVIAPRTWQDRPAGAQRLRWKDRLRLWSYGGSAERAAFRRELLDQNAYFWLVARGRFKPALVWAVLTLLAGGWAWGLAKYHRDWLSEFMCLITGALLNVLLKGWMASETGRQLAEDRTQGTLELLLSTPMTVHDLLRGQLLALKRQFLGPLIVVLAAFFAFMVTSSSLLNEADDRASWILFWLALMLLLVADLAAIYWVGMWQGLTARNPNRATSNCLTRILILPWVAIGIVILLLGLSFLNSDLNLGPKFFLVLWVGLSLAADIGFGAWSRHKLLTEFRLAATQRYTPQARFWKRLLNGGPSST
ncbi:MAG: ABC transporter permease subunit [Verrucomicrobiota bacterium]